MTDALSTAPAAARPGQHARYAGGRAIVAAAVGNALEWYDFSVYALFAIYIAPNVFARGDAAAGLIGAFLVFGIGFFARPVGAVWLGAYADRAGRRAALTLSLVIMAFGTLCIAVAPPYAAIGIGAPLLILCGRLLQGLSAGGEIGGAVSFLVEHAPPERRGRYASWLQSTMAVSNILGALVASSLALWLTPAELAAWGWRIPFILGVTIAPVGLWLRATLAETPAFEAARAARAGRAEPALGPVRDVIREEPRALAVATGVSVVWVAAVYTLVIYLPTYVQRTLHFSAAEAFEASLAGNVCMVFGCIASGWLADRFGRVRMARIGALLLLLGALPLLGWVAAVHTLTALCVGQALFCLLVATFAGSAPSVLAQLFPTRLRSSGVSLSYNFAATVFGGFAPAVLTFLTEGTGIRMAPAFYVMAAAAVSLLALGFMPRKAY